MIRKYKPHIHAELIKAWADGYEIEFQTPNGEWKIISQPSWGENCEYRIYDSLRDVNIGDWLIHLGSKNVYKVIDFVGGVVISEFFHLSVYSIEHSYRKATKKEVLNAPNYSGSATIEDFPLEEGDWIIDRSHNELIAIKFNGVSLPYLFLIIDTTSGKRENMNEHRWCYAKKEEIGLSQNQESKYYKKYIPFTWEDRELLRGKWVKYISFGNEKLIVQLDPNKENWIQTNYESLSSTELLENYTFLDGSPCGKILS